jgi:hypothetical protein
LADIVAKVPEERSNSTLLAWRRMACWSASGSLENKNTSDGVRPIAARPGKFGNNRIRIAGSVNQNSQFDRWARKLFFVPAPKIVLQQYRPIPEMTADGRGVRLLGCTCRGDPEAIKQAKADAIKAGYSNAAVGAISGTRT